MTDSTVRIDGNTLRLPGGVAVRFVRTLRLPETGTHPLPPGLGEFPVRRVTDYPDTAPADWLARGGVMLPVYLREAMWLSFAGSTEPAALQVGVGKVCAVSGKPWSDRLSRRPQNYVVLPASPGWTASTRARARCASSWRSRWGWARPSRARSPARRSGAASSSRRSRSTWTGSPSGARRSGGWRSSGAGRPPGSPGTAARR